jgi:hypothetical protein
MVCLRLREIILMSLKPKLLQAEKEPRINIIV